MTRRASRALQLLLLPTARDQRPVGGTQSCVVVKRFSSVQFRARYHGMRDGFNMNGISINVLDKGIRSFKKNAKLKNKKANLKYLMPLW